MFYHLARYIKLKNFLFSFHLTMMTWSHRNVVLNFFRSFLSLCIIKYILYFSSWSIFRLFANYFIHVSSHSYVNRTIFC